jgi:hypothetical protein
LLIEFLQADLNKYAERVKVEVMPPSGLSEVRECSAENSNGDWKMMNSRHAIKPSNLKCMPTPVISSNRYSLLDCTQDASSNNNNDAINGIHHKHLTIDRGDVHPTKVDLQYSAFRPVKPTYAEDETTHKIPTIINGVTNIGSNDGSELSESDKLHISNCALCRKACNELSPLKNECKLLLIGDSHARGCPVKVKNMINDEFEVCGLVKPGSSASNLTKSINNEVMNLSKNDTLVFWGGSNDVYKNNFESGLNHIQNFVKTSSHTNVILLNAPHRYDLIKSSCQ